MFPSMWAGSNSILMFCFSVQNFQSLHMNLLWRDLLESKDKKELQKGDFKKILTAVYTHQSRQGAEGVQTSRLCMPPSHPRLLFLPNLRNPLSTSSQSCTNHGNTPNPPISSCLPIFWVGKSLWNKKLSATWGSRVTVCNTRNDSPWAAPGRDNLGGEVALRTLRPHSSVSRAVFAGDQQEQASASPRQTCPGPLVRRQEENSSSAAARSGHRKPSLRTQVSRTIHTEVNQPVVNKEKTVIKCVVSHSHNLLRI